MNRVRSHGTSRPACVDAQTRPSSLTALECAQMTDRAVAAALDVAQPADELEFVMHMAACTRCAATLAEFREAAARLGMAVPQIEPPAHLISRLLAAARG